MSAKEVLKIVSALIADKQKRPVPDIGISTMGEEEAARILKIIETEKKTTTTVVKG